MTFEALENQVNTTGTARIAVVGAGASALAALYELYETFGEDRLPHVVLIDGGAGPGIGNVYRDDLDCALVNRQARHMSVIHDRPDDFLDWVASRPDRGNPVDEEYYTRAYFGTYLSQRFTAIADRWRDAGAPIEFVPGYAEGFEEIGGAVLVTLADEVIEADQLLLCTGHGRQDEPSPPDALLRPYPLRELVAQTADANRVAVVGCGLTAIDCALGLLSAETGTVVSMFSRTGVLPDVRADLPADLALTVAPRADHVGATLDELWVRLRAELDAHGVSDADLSEYLDRLRGGVLRFREGGPVPHAHRVIQNIAIAMANRDLPTYWYGFDSVQRKAFYAKYYRLLQAICSPIPPRTARMLRDALEAGRIEVRIGVAERDDDGWAVRTNGGLERFDAIVDGTGDATSSGAERFERSLVAGGAAVAEEFGGVRVDRGNSRLIRPDGAPSRVFVLGYATRGSLLYSSSLYQATWNVKGIAAQIESDTRGAAAEHPVLAPIGGETGDGER